MSQTVPQPLYNLSDKILKESYIKALKLELANDFIEILKAEMTRRHLI